MSYLIDLHIHTNANPHAYSTFEEDINSALKKGMKVIAITNHGPALQDSPHWWSLANMKVLPSEIEGMKILRGVETNIIDEYGNFDINQRVYDIMDIILCGLHSVDSYGNVEDKEKNTRAVLNIMRKQTIDIMVHLGNPQFPIDYEIIVKEAKKLDIAIELNNSSLVSSRQGSEPNCKKILELCKQHECMISLGTDSHISYDIGNFEQAERLIKKICFPEKYIVNSSIESLESFLRLRKNLRAKKI